MDSRSSPAAYAGHVSPTTAGALGLALGLVIGLLALALILRARRPARPADAVPTPQLPRLEPETIGLLETLRSATIVVDTSGQVVRASSSAAVLGLVRDDGIRHQELRTLVHESERIGAIRERELEVRRGPIGAGRVHVAVRVAPLAPGLTVILAEDLTQARQLEETRRDFVVNVSHELKTPVGGLGLLAEAIEDAADDPEAVARFASRMKREVERLTKLVAEIINLSRLQTHEFSSAPERVDVLASAKDAVDQTRTIAEQRHITVSAISPLRLLTCRGDRELIVTAVRNLVTNAIAYSDDRSRVSVVVRRHHDLVEISVSDQGTGIPAMERARIFERFYRVDAARSRATGGTGLGLAIVKHICASHGGDVTVWSQEGQGSTFTIRLPADPPAADGTTDQPATDQPSANRTTPTDTAPTPTDTAGEGTADTAELSPVTGGAEPPDHHLDQPTPSRKVNR